MKQVTLGKISEDLIRERDEMLRIADTNVGEEVPPLTFDEEPNGRAAGESPDHPDNIDPNHIIKDEYSGSGSGPVIEAPYNNQ